MASGYGSPERIHGGQRGQLQGTGDTLFDADLGAARALEASVAEGAAPEVRRLAHSCAGASATCGMRFLVPLLRQMERESAEGDLANSKMLCAQAVKEFERIRQFLEARMAPRHATAAPTQA